MAQVESPKPNRILIKPTITIPADWEPRIKKYMEKKGYLNMADMIRDLIREKIIEAGEN